MKTFTRPPRKNRDNTPPTGELGLINDGSEEIEGKFTFDGYLLDDGEQIQLGSTLFLATYQADWLTGASSGGNDFALQAVPEPSTLILLLLGAAGLFTCSRRRRR